MSKCKICGRNTDNVIICLDIDFPVICENCLHQGIVPAFFIKFVCNGY